MNVVIVKHENCGAKYVFLVPDDKSLKAGDLVMVNTRRGKTFATCLCDSFVVDAIDKEKMKSIFNAFGVDEPTAYVVGKFTYDEWDTPDTVVTEAVNELITVVKKSMG